MSLGPRARTFLRSLLATVLVLAGVETAMRLLAPATELGILARRPHLSLNPGLDRAEEVFSGLDHDALEWAPYQHWVTKPNRQARFYRTNARGFRGPELEVPKPRGRFRIAVLGGSAAWGLGSTGDERTVPGRLQTLLRERFPQRDLDVVNAGQAGFVSGQELIHYHRAVSPLEPDLVLLFDGYNDVEADISNPVSDWPHNAAHLKTRYEDFLRSGRLGADLARALQGSRFLDWAGRQIAERRRGPTPPWVPTVAPQATGMSYTRNALAISRLAAPAPVWVALQPVLATTKKPLAREEQGMLAGKEQAIQGYAERVRAAYAAMESGVRGAGLPLITLDTALGGEPQLLFADECHFGDEAASRVATAIVAEWLARGAIPTIDSARRPRRCQSGCPSTVHGGCGCP